MTWERIEDTGRQLRDNPYCYYNAENDLTYRQAFHALMNEREVPVNFAFLFNGPDILLPGYIEQTANVEYEDKSIEGRGARFLYDYTIKELGNYREAYTVITSISKYDIDPFYITADDERIHEYLGFILSFYMEINKINRVPPGGVRNAVHVIRDLIFTCRHTGKTIVKHNSESDQYLTLKLWEN
ncbi:hypothetical protein [Asticcacaulis benevestitus]|uniref:Uncharacterized protein n=1 Tax=Asticcacaulis benevestitus DSM 16100 = ATCC BAA-896 TaxID=1121022 RepID=V4PF50_9CAUL|nr:hypothetical protein [Asticcacaulis benevestitus]ESQ92572.1 hypothetical protein ABENE_08005 [Asticcacaulis benevestitus DSM 16100 = ATCC BAA-896]